LTVRNPNPIPIADARTINNYVVLTVTVDIGRLVLHEALANERITRIIALPDVPNTVDGL